MISHSQANSADVSDISTPAVTPRHSEVVLADGVLLPENILSLSTSRRDWNGVRVEVARFECAGRVVHRLQQSRHALLSVVLEEVGGRVEPRLQKDQPCSIGYTPRHMHFAPAGMETWGFTDDVRFVKDAGLSFDFAALGERLGIDLDAAVVATPRLRFSDDRLWTLVRLLADAVDSPDPSAQLYGDGLITAVASLLFSGRPEPRRQDARGLAPWQLSRSIEYMNTYLPKRIELVNLAALVGLSQSHFSRAFKVSTGMAPTAGNSTPASVAPRSYCSIPALRSIRWPARLALPMRSTSAGPSGSSRARRPLRGARRAMRPATTWQQFQTVNHRISQ